MGGGKWKRALIQNRYNNYMALTQNQKYGYGFFLFLTILLVGLHMAVCAFGYKWSKEYRDDNIGVPVVDIYSGLYYDEIKQEISFIIIAAALTFFLSVALLIAICSQCLSPKARHVLATLNVILEFAIAVVLALRASNNSNLKDSSLDVYDQYDNFRKYYKLVLADTIITFVLQVIYLFVIWWGTLKEIIYAEIITPVVAEVPPLSNRQF